MKNNWKEWLQVISNLTIVAGIILVVIELGQTQRLVQAQLVSDRQLQRANLHASFAGENPNQILAKACTNPNELTTEEVIALTQLFQAQIFMAASVRGPANVANLGTTYEDDMRRAFRSILNYQHGRDFLQRLDTNASTDWNSIREEELARDFPSDCEIGSGIPGGF